MKPMNFNEFEKFDVVEVQEKLYLFTNMRVDRKTIPEGSFAYDVRDDCGDGEFAQVQPFVMVDHWGTIIGPAEIELDSFGQYQCNGEDGSFTGEYYDYETFVKKYPYGRNGYYYKTEGGELLSMGDMINIVKFYEAAAVAEYIGENYNLEIDEALELGKKVREDLDDDSAYVDDLSQWEATAIDRIMKKKN